jgi:hypothetical protein
MKPWRKCCGNELQARSIGIACIDAETIHHSLQKLTISHCQDWTYRLRCRPFKALILPL